MDTIADTVIHPIAGLVEGRCVHYVLPDGPSKGEHRPATIVKVWDSINQGTSNLVVLMDGSNDYSPYSPESPLVSWRTSIVMDNDEERIGTWHWIEKA